MKTKFLLAALSLPMVFAACSNELDEINSNFEQNNNADGLKVELNLVNDLKLDARATWSGSALGWSESDQISMYWTGLKANATAGVETALTGSTNAIFKTTDGAKFTSESLVFEGLNAVVFPANTNHFTEKAIEISVAGTQTAATVNSVPFISNLLDVQDNKNYTDNKAGYNKSIYAPMKLAANVVTLKLKMTNTEALEKYGFNVESVELEAANGFATKSNLVAMDLGTDKDGKKIELEEQGFQYFASKDADGKAITDSVPSIKQSLWTKPATFANSLTSSAIKKNDDGSYDVTFVVLPTDAEAVADAKIVVYTTCGTVTLNADDKDKKDNLVNFVVKAAAKPAATDTVTIDQALAFFASSIDMPADTKASSFDNEKVGRTIARSIVVDASQAVLDGSKVKSSEDIIRYVNLYKDMKKTDKMNLVMTVDGTDAAAWKNLTKEAVAAIDAVNAANEKAGYGMLTLTSANATEIILSSVGEVYNVKSYVGTPLPLSLKEGEWTMNDTFAMNEIFTNLTNRGTLTIAGTLNKDKKQNIVAATIVNSGTIELSGAKLYMNGAFVNAANGVVNVAANQELSFREDIANGQLHGTINVAKDGMLTIADSKSVYNVGVINNEGIVAAEGKTNGLYNAACVSINKQHAHTSGVINILSDDAITYVQNNTATINMFNRDNEVVVNANTGKIVYNWNYAEDGAEFKVLASDRFSYVVFDAAATNVSLYTAKDYSIAGISLEFQGSTTLVTNKQTIADLNVTAGANLKINSENVLNVTNLSNKGTITIGGIINYTGTFTEEGRVLSVGSGAIIKK